MLDGDGISYIFSDLCLFVQGSDLKLYGGIMSKKWLLLVLLSTIPLLLQAQVASALLIDFETYPGGAPTYHLDNVSTQFSSWGISLITSEDAPGSIASPVIRQDTAPWFNYASGVSALAPWVGKPDGTTYYGPAQAPITVYFTTPISYFSIYAMDVGWNGLLAEAYGAGSSLISSVSIDGTGRDHDGPLNSPDWLDFIEFNYSGITEIRFAQIHGPDWDRANGLATEGYLLDDMTFYPVPEPGTILLLGTGLAGLAGLRQRYRSKSKSVSLRSSLR